MEPFLPFVFVIRPTPEGKTNEERRKPVTSNQ